VSNVNYVIVGPLLYRSTAFICP